MAQGSSKEKKCVTKRTRGVFGNTGPKQSGAQSTVVDWLAPTNQINDPDLKEKGELTWRSCTRFPPVTSSLSMSCGVHGKRGKKKSDRTSMMHYGLVISFPSPIHYLFIICINIHEQKFGNHKTKEINYKLYTVMLGFSP